MGSSIVVVSSRLLCSAWLKWILALALQSFSLFDLASIADFMYADSNCAILENSVYLVYLLEFPCPQSWCESLVWLDMPLVLSVAVNVASFFCEGNSEVSFAAKDLCTLFGHNLVILWLRIRITLQFSRIPLLKSVMIFLKLKARYNFTLYVNSL